MLSCRTPLYAPRAAAAALAVGARAADAATVHHVPRQRRDRPVNSTLKRVLVTAAVGATAAFAPAPPAHAATGPAAAGGTLTFVPPQMGRIVVVIGPIIIGGKVMSPGLRVESPGVSLPTMTVTLPSWPPLAP